MASTKLLLITLSGGTNNQSINVSSYFPSASSSTSLNFLGNGSISLGQTLATCPVPVWDASSNLVSLAVSPNKIVSVRSGQQVAQTDWPDKDTSTKSGVEKLVTIFRSQATTFFVFFDSSSKMNICCRAADWSTSGNWLYGPLPQSSGDNYVFASVGNDWIYMFSTNFVANPEAQWLSFSVIEPNILRNSMALKGATPITNRQVSWSTYNCATDQAQGITGRPSIILTGSTSTNRSFHVFAFKNGVKEIWYWQFPLQANGLPANSFASTSFSNPVDAVNPVRVVSNAAGPFTAAVYGSSLYLFYTTTSSASVSCTTTPWANPSQGWTNVSTSHMPQLTQETGTPGAGITAVSVQFNF